MFDIKANDFKVSISTTINILVVNQNKTKQHINKKRYFVYYILFVLIFHIFYREYVKHKNNIFNKKTNCIKLAMLKHQYHSYF